MRGQIRYNDLSQLHLMSRIYACKTANGNTRNNRVATCYKYLDTITKRS